MSAVPASAARFLWLRAQCHGSGLPPPQDALDDPPGLLAVGGDLEPATLLAAYRAGSFPWSGPGEPLLWWSPDPRAVLQPAALHCSRSLRRRLRRGDYTVSFDRAFAQVTAQCAAPRRGAAGTWLTAPMRAAYQRLHALGVAHSAEAWQDGELVGGLYGVALGRVFFGESMFARRPDASKAAFAVLMRRLLAWGFALVDCQVASAHLRTLGAVDMPRAEFLRLLAVHAGPPDRTGPWHADDDL